MQLVAPAVPLADSNSKLQHNNTRARVGSFSRMHLSSLRLQSKHQSQVEVCSGWGRPCRRPVAARVGTNPSHHSRQYNRRQCCQAQQYDLIGLSNLCVDVVVNVDSLPGKDEGKRLQLLHQVIDCGCGICQASLCMAATASAHLTCTLCVMQLTAAPPSEEHWELGGNCNCLIAVSGTE